MVEFKTATVEDSAFIAELEKRCIECAWSQKTVEQTVADELSVIYLLVADGCEVGYGGIRTVLDEAEIYNVAVTESERKKGYGRQIVNKLICEARRRGAKKVFLEVNENNAAALALYAACGFKKISERKNYYKSGSALIMLKEI